MKFSEIITEQYENQDPNRPPDNTEYGESRWFDTDGELHRDGDLPAFVDPDGSQSWWQHSLLHRETGPAAIWANGAVEYALNGEEYTEEEWAEKVGMRKHEMLMMKNKLGLH